MKDMNYTYLEIKHLQLFAKSALMDEIIEMLKTEHKRLDDKNYNSHNTAEKWLVGAKATEVGHIIEMLKAKKKEIKVQIIEVRDQMAIEK